MLRRVVVTAVTQRNCYLCGIPTPAPNRSKCRNCDLEYQATRPVRLRDPCWCCGRLRVAGARVAPICRPCRRSRPHGWNWRRVPRFWAPYVPDQIVDSMIIDMEIAELEAEELALNAECERAQRFYEARRSLSVLVTPSDER